MTCAPVFPNLCEHVESYDVNLLVEYPLLEIRLIYLYLCIFHLPVSCADLIEEGLEYCQRRDGGRNFFHIFFTFLFSFFQDCFQLIIHRLFWFRDSRCLRYLICFCVSVLPILSYLSNFSFSFSQSTLFCAGIAYKKLPEVSLLSLLRYLPQPFFHHHGQAAYCAHITKIQSCWVIWFSIYGNHWGTFSFVSALESLHNLYAWLQ